MTLEEQNTFLSEQLASATAILKAYQARDSDVGAAIEKAKAQTDAGYRAQRQADLMQMEQRIDLYRVFAERYAFLRQFFTQAWALGIAAQEQNLDAVIDEAMRRRNG